MIRAFIISLLLTASLFAQQEKQIALTIDDLPLAEITGLNKEQRQMISDRILAALDKHNVHTIGFVIGRSLNSRNQHLLDEFVQAGHIIGNHTFSHLSLSAVSAAEYCEDILRTHFEIEDYMGDTAYFRYPFLERGITAAQRDSVYNFLEVNNYINVPVTIPTEDWGYNNSLMQAYIEKDTAAVNKIGSEYINSSVTMLKEWQQFAENNYLDPPPQIMLIHMNLLNALFLDELLTEIKEDGWNFISPVKAIEHEFYNMKDNYAGPRGLSWLERVRF